MGYEYCAIHKKPSSIDVERVLPNGFAVRFQCEKARHESKNLKRKQHEQEWSNIHFW